MSNMFSNLFLFAALPTIIREVKMEQVLYHTKKISMEFFFFKKEKEKKAIAIVFILIRIEA